MEKTFRQLLPCASPFLHTRPRQPESRAAESHTRLTFAYQKKKSPPPPVFSFSFGFCELCLALCQKTSLCFSLLCHISSIGMRPPTPTPAPPPASFHHGREGKQSWHRLFNEEQSSGRGEEAPFSTHIKIQAAPTKGPGQAAQPQFHLTRSVLFFISPPPVPTSSQTGELLFHWEL